MKNLIILTISVCTVLFMASMASAQIEPFGGHESFLNPNIQEANKFYGRRDFEHAYSLALPDAERGDPAAQTMIGAMYKNGYGREADFSNAMKWLRAAADQNFRPAMINIARIYDDGILTPRDTEEALKWYGKAGQNQFGVSRYADLFFHKDSDTFSALAYAYDPYEPMTSQARAEKAIFVKKLNDKLKAHIELPHELPVGMQYAFDVDFDKDRNVVSITNLGVSGCKGCKEGEEEKISNYGALLDKAYASIENGIRQSSPLPELPSWVSKTRKVRIFYPQEIRDENKN